MQVQITRPLLGVLAAMALVGACGDDSSPSKKLSPDEIDGGMSGRDSGANEEDPDAANPDEEDPDEENPSENGTAAKYHNVYYSDGLGTHRVNIATQEKEPIATPGGGFEDPVFVSPKETYIADGKKVARLSDGEIVFQPPGGGRVQLFLSDNTLLTQIFGQKGFKKVVLPANTETAVDVNDYEYCFVTPNSLSKTRDRLAIACKGKIVLWDTTTGAEVDADTGDGSVFVNAAAWIDGEHFAYAVDKTIYVQRDDLSAAVSVEIGRIGGVIQGGPGKAWFTSETVGQGGLRIATWHSVDSAGKVAEIPWLTALGALPAQVVVSGDGSQVVVTRGSVVLYAADGSGETVVVAAPSAPNRLLGAGVAR